MKRWPFALGAMGLLVCGLARAQVDSGGNEAIGKLRDLYYGDVLFHYFQNDDYGALSRLMAMRALGRGQAHTNDGDLLQAWLLLSLGQPQDAIAAFENAVKAETRPELRNKIWLALGRTLHQRGDDTEALIALRRIDAPLQGDLEADRQLLTAQILIDAGRFDEAAASLQAWKGAGDWMPYARYNLGVALVRAGRLADGERQLNEVDRLSLQDPEQQALRDRANTSLGYTRIQVKDWDQASVALRRVRLQSASANQALLGLGWAELGGGRDKEALTPWVELASRDSSDVAVQEALLAVPYAIARGGSLSGAASRYRDAFNRFDKEHERLQVLIDAVKKPAFIDRLLDVLNNGEAAKGDRPLNDGRQVAPLSRLPGGAEYVDLTDLIASDRFQSALRNARDLGFFRGQLDRMSERIDTMETAAPDASDWAAQREHIARLSESCDQMLLRQRSVLQEQATAELKARQVRLRDYQGETRFAEARLFDRSANAPAPAKPAATGPKATPKVAPKLAPKTAPKPSTDAKKP